MTKLRIVFILSLVLLAALLVSTVFRPMATDSGYSVVSRESVLQGEDRWIIELDIINQEGKDITYTVIWSSGEESKTQKIRVGDGRIYNHIHFVYPEAVKEDKVNLTIYKEGEATPFEEATYYLE